MKSTTIGVDIGKAVFHVHGVDAEGKTVFSKSLKRAQLKPFLHVSGPASSEWNLATPQITGRGSFRRLDMT